MPQNKYFGVSPTNTRDVENRYRYVATAGQTTFVANYDVGLVDVYYNGSHLDPNTFTAVDGVSIVLANPASSGSTVVIVGRRQIKVGVNLDTSIGSPTYTATAGQTSFSLTYTAGSVYMVQRNGIGVPFTASNGTSVVLSTAANAGDIVQIFYMVAPFAVANAVNKGGDTMTGPLALASNSTAPTPTAGDNSTKVATTAFVTGALTGGTIVTQDTSTGAANLPAGTTAQRPANGAGKIRINTDTGRFEGNNGSNWGSLGGATGGGSDAVFYENGQVVNSSYTISAGSNAMSAGPILISNGAIVTIPNGSTWTIV